MMTASASNHPATTETAKETAAMQPHVRMTGIIKDLGAFRAVDNVSLDIPRGSMLTLLGPSGCGKSTTLRLLAGFYQPTQGEIFLGDECITALPPNKRRMTMVFQEYALFPHLSVASNVAYGLVMRKATREHIRQRVGEMLELVGLEGAAEKISAPAFRRPTAARGAGARAGRGPRSAAAGRTAF